MTRLVLEICAEDRERLDKLLEVLAEKQSGEESVAEVLPMEAEAPQDDAAPPVTLADIQKKVVSLSAAGKKSQVRDIVKAYAERVSQIPQDKLSEVYAKLADIETN